MLAVQHRLPLVSVRTRYARRPFHPSQDQGAYRLPHAVRDRLASLLAPFRNRDAAFALAVFLARFWSTPGRVAGSFPIDRRALADHAGLDLTEARVRGAIRTLEAVGFLDRAIPAPGSLYKPTPEGLHRKPVLFVFGADYAPAFIAANARAAAAHGRRLGERRPLPAENARRPSAAVPAAPDAKSPKSKSAADPLVLMGEITKSGSPPPAFELIPQLADALDRLGRAILNHRQTASADEKAADRQDPPRAAPGRDSWRRA
jgi:hypothetical protein